MNIFPRDKKASKNCKNNFWAIFPKGKKGMEMWKLVIIMLAIICLFVLLAFYKDIYEAIVDVLAKLEDLFW